MASIENSFNQQLTALADSAKYSGNKKPLNMKITYSSNNSGGSWWLDDQDWKNLEAAGWNVDWRERQLGAIATSATIECESIDVAIAKWENVTKQDASDEGCNCCGQPHNFYKE